MLPLGRRKGQTGEEAGKLEPHQLEALNRAVGEALTEVEEVMSRSEARQQA